MNLQNGLISEFIISYFTKNFIVSNNYCPAISDIKIPWSYSIRSLLTILSHFYDSFVFIFIFFFNFLSMYPLVARSTYYYHVFMIGPSHTAIPIIVAYMVVVCRREVFHLLTGITEKHVVRDKQSFFSPFSPFSL